MKVIPYLTAFLLVGAVAISARADLVLPEGITQYRLAFVTSGTTAATSSDIEYYNSLVSTAVSSSPELAGLGAEWKAIASTSTVNARANTGTTGDDGIPIYTVMGVKVADSSAEFWDGGLDTAINVTESGSSYDSFVWTGTLQDGAIGSSLGQAIATYGFAFFQSANWVDFGSAESNTSYPLYALSSVITAVPEAGQVLCFSIVSLGLAIRRRRSKVG